MPVTSYDGISQTHTLDVSVDTFLVPGIIYDIRISAQNLIGSSEYSDHLRQALSALPISPINLRRVETSCTKTQIAITWDPVVDGYIPGGIISGYMLYMANGTSSNYYLIYNGTDRPLIRTQIISGLVSG